MHNSFFFKTHHSVLWTDISLLFICHQFDHFTLFIIEIFLCLSISGEKALDTWIPLLTSLWRRTNDLSELCEVFQSNYNIEHKVNFSKRREGNFLKVLRFFQPVQSLSSEKKTAVVLSVILLEICWLSPCELRTIWQNLFIGEKEMDVLLELSPISPQ